MKRSVGVTISAVIAFVGSSAALLGGTSVFLAISLAPVAPSQPPFLRCGTYFFGILWVAFAVFIALSTFWLWFFNKRTIREQFRGGQQPDSFDAHAPHRPLSISIIACILLLGAFTLPVIFFLHFPVFLLGFFLRGSGAAMIWLALCLLQVVMGVGLLRLKAWARMTSIYYFAFFMFNSLAILLIPGTQARFQVAQAEILRRLAPTIGSVPNQGHFPMWFGLVSALPF